MLTPRTLMVGIGGKYLSAARYRSQCLARFRKPGLEKLRRSGGASAHHRLGGIRQCLVGVVNASWRFLLDRGRQRRRLGQVLADLVAIALARLRREELVDR